MMNSKSLGWYKQADAKEQQIFREWVLGVLKTSTVDLTFEKKDGTIREMKATLMESMLPAIEKKTDRVRKDNPEVLSMFDVEKNEWRSCRFDSIQNVNFTLGQ